MPSNFWHKKGITSYVVVFHTFESVLTTVRVLHHHAVDAVLVVFVVAPPRESKGKHEVLVRFFICVYFSK